ncbi:FBD-like protein [Tanacetum coccineum]
MTKWMDEAVRLKVRELEVQSGLREFPISVFTCKTLTKLHIENCSRLKVMEWHSPFNLPCLKTLSIVVFCNPSLNAFKLIRGCPILETLSLTVLDQGCGHPEDYIFNIHTLKHLKLEVTGKCNKTINNVVLNVPTLEDLFIGGWWCSHFVMEDFPSLVSVKFSSFVPWLEHLWVELLKGISRSMSISFN